MDKFSLKFDDESTAEYWDRIYDQQDFHGECYRLRLASLLAWLDDLELPEHSRILDAGCGAGRFAREAAMRGYEVLAMDYSRQMLTKAAENCHRQPEQNTAFFQADLQALPVQPASLNVIVCMGVVGYLRSLDEGLSELARISSPGGVLAISFANKACLMRRVDLVVLLRNMLLKAMGMWKIARWPKKQLGADQDDAFATYFIPKFRKSLEAAGFTVLDYTTVPWELPTLAGKEVLPRKMAAKLAVFFERFRHIPLVESVGGMCVVKAKKRGA